MSLGISREERVVTLLHALRGSDEERAEVAREIIAALSAEPSPDVWEARSYADWQQQRGMASDVIRNAIEEWADLYATASGHVVSEVYRGSLATDIKHALALPDPPKVTVEEDRA